MNRARRRAARGLRTMKKPLTTCCNGDGRPVHPPSWVLCQECFAVLREKFERLRTNLRARVDKEQTDVTE